MRSALILSSLLVFGPLVSGLAADAAEAITTNNVVVQPKDASANIRERETQTVARFALLKELVAIHEERAREARKEKQDEKAAWEENLVRELTEKANEAAITLEQLTRERIAPKSAVIEPAAPVENATESAFLTRIDTHLWRIEEDIRVAAAANTTLSTQLQTNNTPEEMLRVSYAAQENTAIVRALERERSQLELQKLQYEALRSVLRTK